MKKLQENSPVNSASPAIASIASVNDDSSNPPVFKKKKLKDILRRK